MTFNKARTIRKLFVYMATLLQIILEFQRKFDGTDTVEIENIDVQ
jgi:hypothetical protein